MIKQRKPPMREQIAQDLWERISAGEFAAGSRLPPVRELADRYNVSTKTAHEAVKVLLRTGVVTSLTGSGVYVPAQSASSPSERLHRIHTGKGVIRPGETATILRTELVANPPSHVVEHLDLDEGSAAGCREYIITSATGRVVTYGTSWFTAEVWEAVLELRSREPIPDGNIGAIHRTLHRNTVAVPCVRQARIGEPGEIEILEVQPGAAVLEEITDCVDADGLVTEYNVSIHPSGYWIASA